MELLLQVEKDNVTRELRFNQPLILPCNGVAVYRQTLDSECSLRVVNLSKSEKATFFVVSDSECDGTYTLPTTSPGHQWTCTTNFRTNRIMVTNLSPGAASIEVVLLDMTGEY